jgi:hypothetical protein
MRGYRLAAEQKTSRRLDVYRRCGRVTMSNMPAGPQFIAGPLTIKPQPGFEPRWESHASSCNSLISASPPPPRLCMGPPVLRVEEFGFKSGDATFVHRESSLHPWRAWPSNPHALRHAVWQYNLTPHAAVSATAGCLTDTKSETFTLSACPLARTVGLS